MTRPSSHTRPLNGRVLWLARTDASLTQAQVAERIQAAGCYMDDSRVSRLELGKVPYPSLPLLAALTAVYGLPQEQLTAPCETCGQGWSPACMKHPASPARDPAASDSAPAEAGELLAEPAGRVA